MGTLYIVGAPAGAPNDLTHRARRILVEADLIATADLESARNLLTRLGITTALVEVQDLRRLLDALANGDLALLQDGCQVTPGPDEYRVIRAALDGGYPVVPIPGPSLAITALVISGLPTDSFVYLGHLPELPARRQALLASLSAETRTLVALASPEDLTGLWAGMHAALGSRQAILVGASEAGTAVVWRGALADEPGWHPAKPGAGLHVLVVAGAEEDITLWDEARLRAAIRASLARGLGAKGVSRALAGESGWPRRAIYDLAVELAKEPPSET